MNIGIVTTWFERGAAYVSKQYMDLLAKENNVFIYARGGEEYAIGDNNWDKNNVTWGKKSYMHVIPTFINKKDFKKWIDKNNIETVLFNEQQWWMPVLWCKEWGIKTGAYIDYYTEETLPFFGVYDFLICNTKKHFSAFNWHPQCYYLPWGTNVDVYKPQNKRLEDKEKVVFFNSSGMNPDRKGVYPLIKAFNEVKGPKKLILHSQLDLKNYYKDLRGIFEELEKNEELEIISQTVTAPGLYHLADVYCYISKLDGIGLTLPEAISCGLQGITPNNAPMNEFIDEEEGTGKLVKVERLYARRDGYYWPQCDVQTKDLVKQMQYYLDNMEKLDDMKKKSREHALRVLDWKDREKELEEIFEMSKILGIEKDSVKDIKWFETKRARNFNNIFAPLYHVYIWVKRRRK